jgi:hypothetical protein
MLQRVDKDTGEVLLRNENDSNNYKSWWEEWVLGRASSYFLRPWFIRENHSDH